jgi:peroxiredoxin Q/BCP
MSAASEGKKAPDFALTDKSGAVVELSSFKSPFTVLFFYPKDDTPGCTIESKEFSKNLDKLKKAGATVIGISGGSDASKAAFCKKYGLKTLMLSDPDFKTAAKYGAYGDKSFMGRSYKGILRKTFILDKSHKVIKIYDKVSPEGHSKEVIEFLKTMKSPTKLRKVKVAKASSSRRATKS